MIDLTSIIAKIKSELQHCTQEELASNLGIAQTTVSAIVRGERTIGMKTYQAIAAARPEWIRNPSPDRGD
jgi:transcriptional regulator with XRE-family HTH domain